MGNDLSKPVILILTFGTSIPEGVQDLENADRMVMARYPENEVRWAFGGIPVRECLLKSGRSTVFERRVPVRSLLEVYDDLRKEGKLNVTVQYLFLLPGSKGTDPHMAVGDTNGLNVEFGYPLFAPPDNIARTVKVLAPRFGGEDTVTLLCAHGSGEASTLNTPLLQMDSYVRKHYQNVFLATLEGPPGRKPATEDIRKSGLSKVKFFPLLFTTGGRLTTAFMGDDPSTLQSQLGLEATTIPGLASDPEIMSIWMESIDWSLAKFSK